MYCKKLMIFILGVMVALAASAQVYRCKVTSGKIIYKDTLCTGSQDTKLIKRAPTDIEVLEEHLRKSEENERKAGVRAEMAEDSSYVSDHKNRTVNINYHNDSFEKSKSSECTSAKNDLDFVSRIQTLSPEVRHSRMSASTLNVQISCR